jgi:hypothetical protein
MTDNSTNYFLDFYVDLVLIFLLKKIDKNYYFFRNFAYKMVIICVFPINYYTQLR